MLLETTEYHAVLEPANGLVLTELDYLKTPINLSDTLTRRKEAYHHKLLALAQQAGSQGNVSSIHDMVRTKEPGLEGKLFYDRARRASLVEHWVPLGTGVEEMLRTKQVELADFGMEKPKWKATAPKKKGQGALVQWARNGKARRE